MTDIKRGINIELQLSGSKAAKAEADSFKRIVRSAADEAQQSFSRSFSAAEAAAKQHLDNIAKYSKSAAAAFAPGQFANPWLSEIDKVEKRMKQMEQQILGSRLPSSAPANSPAGPGRQSSAPNKPASSPVGGIWQGNRFVESSNADQVSKAESASIAALDRQRSRAYEAQLKFEERLAKQRETEAERQQKREEAAAKKRQSELEKWQSAHENANRQITNSSKAVLEGSLQVAKGLVYSGLVSEQSMEKVARAMIRVEAASNLVKGTIGVWQGVSDVLKAARTATLAQAAANELLAASQASVAATATVGGVAGGAGRVAGSTIGNIAGNVAAGAAGGAVGSGVANAGSGRGWIAAGTALATGNAGLIASGAGLGLALSESLSGVRRAFGDTSTSAESFVGAMRSWWKAESNLQKSTENLTKAEEARQRRLDQFRQSEANITGKAAMRTALVDRAQADRRMFAELDPNLTPMQRAQQSRASAVSELEKAEAAREAYLQRVSGRKSRGESFSFADQTQMSEQDSRAAELRKAAEQEIANILKQQLDLRRQNVSQAHAEVAQAKSRFEQEMENTRTKMASYGRMTSGEQARLADISKRHQQGQELSRADIDALERSGFGGEIVKSHWEKKAKAAGGLNVLGGLGERDAEDDAHLDYQVSQSELAKAQVLAKQTVTELSDQFKKLKEAAEAATRAFQDLQRAQGAQNGIGPSEVGSTPANNGQDVAALGLGVESSAIRMGQSIQRNFNLQDDQFRRHAERRAASEIV